MKTSLVFPSLRPWAEQAEIAGRERVYMHVFYELADGSALAFFQVASPVDDDFGRSTRTTLLDHIAFSVDANTQEEIKSRLHANGVPVQTIDHGYVKSIYAVDPDGLNIEFTVDGRELSRDLRLQEGASPRGTQAMACGRPYAKQRPTP